MSTKSFKCPYCRKKSDTIAIDHACIVTYEYNFETSNSECVDSDCMGTANRYYCLQCKNEISKKILKEQGLEVDF
jgi:DNA-directed RNA polymerase subunit RPC12/RpoP